MYEVFFQVYQSFKLVQGYFGCSSCFYILNRWFQRFGSGRLFFFIGEFVFVEFRCVFLFVRNSRSYLIQLRGTGFFFRFIFGYVQGKNRDIREGCFIRLFYVFKFVYIWIVLGEEYFFSYFLSSRSVCYVVFLIVVKEGEKVC